MRVHSPGVALAALLSALVTGAPARADEHVPVPASEPLLPPPDLLPGTHPAPAPRGDARVHFRSSDDGEELTLTQERARSEGAATLMAAEPAMLAFVDVRVSTHAPLCTGPCDIVMPPGRYVFGLMRANGKMASAYSTVRVEDGTELVGTYVSHAALRTAGWITLFGGGALGAGIAIATLASAGRDERCSERPGVMCDREINTPLLLTGLAVSAVSIITGIVLRSFDDEAIVRSVRGRTAQSGHGLQLSW